MTRILPGIILALIGAGLDGSGVAWSYFGIPFLVTDGFQNYIRIQIGLYAAAGLFTSVGIYLILTAILRILPRASRWATPGPLLVLIGGLLGTFLSLVELALIAVTLSPSGGTLPEWVGEAEIAVRIAAQLAGALGMVLSLVAIVRGALARMAYPSPTLPA